MVEIIIAIGVLAVVSMFVLQLYVKASNIERKAHDLDIACVTAQTLMERCKASGRYAADEIYYDANWEQIDTEEQSEYVVTMEVSQVDGLNKISIAVDKKKPYLLESQAQTIHVLTGSTRLEVSPL